MRARDLVGYGLSKPDLLWPNGTRLAVAINVNYEEGAEFTVENGDPHTEQIGEVVSVVPVGRRDLGMEELFAYGLRAGLPRFLDALEVFRGIGLVEHLSAQRANGLRSMVNRIQHEAVARVPA